MNKLLLLTFTCIIFNSIGQNSVKIRKTETNVYRGVADNIKTWYIYQYDTEYFLCTLTIAEEEVEAWFKKRMNSQNIYKGKPLNQQYNTIVFVKENDPMDRISFYFSKKENALFLKGIKNNESFEFEKIKIDR